MVELVGTQIVGEPAHRLQRLRGNLGDPFQLFARTTAHFGALQRDLGAMLDDEQLPPQSVVQLAAEALALLLLALDELAGELFLSYALPTRPGIAAPERGQLSARDRPGAKSPSRLAQSP